MKWSDIIKSGGFNAFIAGLAAAWGLEAIFNGRTSYAAIHFGCFLINAVAFIMCTITYRQKIVDEVEIFLSPIALPPHIYPIPVAPVQETVSEKKEEVTHIQESHHEGRLLRVEGEKNENKNK